MKGRESSMPPKKMWEGFFNPIQVLTTMDLNRARDVAEFGCGYGTFTIPAAQMIKGKIYAIDIESNMTEATEKEAKDKGLNNVETILRDFLKDGTGLAAGSVDYVMLFNILHIENPEIMLAEAWRILRHSGRLGIIHWNYDASTPRGPSMDIRLKPSDCIKLAQNAGFFHPKQYDLKLYHYGIVMEKE